MSLYNADFTAIIEEVRDWRMQENIDISLYTFYVYYVLTTTREEVSVIFPLKWKLGKVLFFLMRYSSFVYMAIHLLKDFRTYIVISPQSCKVMALVYDVSYWLAVLPCDITLGLSLGALLQVRELYLAAIVLLCVASSFVGAIFDTISDAQYPAVTIGELDLALGYPCTLASREELLKVTIEGIAPDIRRYADFAGTVG
ncbi:hypothetical protein D9611_010090 [Ephemerocybe angulata]|uniref:Uncharacterized protein n=1 Tax=Ephemerocybe angulata TaxID=980116 RepID=A0A8H5B0X8_9AGAR|nr:hypothetical protein D9611_010090 [Tulosesus angulatus]